MRTMVDVGGRRQLVVCPPERLPEMFRLRASVWIAEGADPSAFPGGEWRNDRDASRLHWIVLDNDRVVASASLGIYAAIADVEEGDAYVRAGLASPGPVAAPARLTVAPDSRGRGIVQALLDVQDEAAVEAGAVLAVRQASPALRTLLGRRGWQSHGPGPSDPRFPVQFTIMSLVLGG